MVGLAEEARISAPHCGLDSAWRNGSRNPRIEGRARGLVAHLVRFQGFVASDTTLEKRDIHIYN